jgi:hypothetical protein
MIKYQESRLSTFAAVPEIKTFLESHKPIAFDHCGDNFWIDLQSGRIHYIIWNTWKEGAIEISSSFREFVEKYWNIPRDLWPIYEPPCGRSYAKQ